VSTRYTKGENARDYLVLIMKDALRVFLSGVVVDWWRAFGGLERRSSGGMYRSLSVCLCVIHDFSCDITNSKTNERQRSELNE